MINNRKRFMKFSFLAIFSFTCIPNVFAQNTNPNLEKLTASSELIIVGNVKEVESRWNQNKTSIFTTVNIQTSEYLKGQANENKLVLTVPGGEIENVGEFYTHLPRFTKDEEILLFLKKENDNYSIIGGDIGKITFSRNEKDDRKIEMSRERVHELKKSIKNYLLK